MKLRNIIRALFNWCLLLLLLAGTLTAAYFLYTGHSLYKDARNQADLTTLVTSIRQKPEYTVLSDIPQIYKDAVVAAEDQRFYSHKGFDLLATARAAFHDIKARKFVEGGSTITQQLAKNLWFTQEKKLSRKVAEVFAAFDIERTYTKDEILELYINSIYYGDGYYSIQAASMGYFGKTPAQMTDAQSTLLAGIPNAPSAYSPSKHPDLAKKRQAQVLQRMIKCNYLTKEEADAIASSF
ncbi:MAG: transglycosylase domain-containing protein [Lachnospiraceae bacterium]